MIDLRRLEALVALRRFGTVSAAAEHLHYGQPTVSHHLRRLEVETGSVLVQRVGRGEEVLGLLGRAEAELSASTGLRAGRVRLAGFPSGAATLVPAAIGLLAERHPGVELELVEAEPPESAALLRAGRADLALTFAYPGGPPPEGITTTPVLADPLLLVLPADAGEPRLDDLADARWITGCERCRSELLALCAAAGFEPRIAFASDDYVAVQSLVASDVGVTVLPGLALRAHRHPGVVARPLDAARTVQVATHGAPPRPAVVDAVASVLTEVAGQVAGQVSPPRARPRSRRAATAGGRA